jgi:hypothetical protein
MLNKKIISSFEALTLIFSIIAFTSLVAPTVSAESAFEDFDEEAVLLTDFADFSGASDSIGCCYDEDQGFCSSVSERNSCEAEENSIWHEGKPFCDLTGGICEQGCCSIGHRNIFTTERHCVKQSELQGIESEFDRSITSESVCIGLDSENNLGACVTRIGAENTCVFTSGVECVSIGGEFAEGALCSNEELDTECEKQSYIGCLDGKDGVYWYDSCDNPENIYEKDKADAWNNGMILSPDQSCNPTSSNSRSNSCGNCGYLRGSICTEAEDGDTRMSDGDFTCRDLNCKDAPSRVNAEGEVLDKENRINGESWCVYDGPVGGFGLFGGEVALFSQDLVGSRHYRYICEKGEVKVNPCADYRKEICVEGESENGGSSATCRLNAWEQCLGYNSNGECNGACLPQCVLNPDCRLHHVSIDTDFTFSTCAPKYPAGFASDELSTLIGGVASEVGIGDALGGASDIAAALSGGISAGSVCGVASKTCISTWKKVCKPTPKWVCVNNCNCHTDSFSMQMNNLCISIGDCGVYSNIFGNPTPLSGTTVRKDGKHGRTPLSPKIIGLAYMVLSLLPPSEPIPAGDFDEPSDILDLGSGPLGGLVGIVDPFLGNVMGTSGGNYGLDFEPSGLGVTGNLLVAGGVAAVATTAIASTGTLGSAIGVLGPLGINPIGLVIVVVIVAITFVMGCGKTEQVEIQFTCAPSGVPIGADCEACDGGELKPCSKYKCESMGIGCELINEDTGQDECIRKEGIEVMPVITSYHDALNHSVLKYEGETREGFKIRTLEGECLPSNTVFSFGVKTENVPSVCGMSREPLEFEEMENAFFENMAGVFTRNHTAIRSIPSIGELVYTRLGSGEGEDPVEYAGAVDELTEAFSEEMASIDYYVKCMNPMERITETDYRINICVNPGPDISAPIIVGADPTNEAVLAFGAGSQDVTFYTNEAADCKWDTVRPVQANMLDNYNELANTMECSATSTDLSRGIYPCTTSLPIDQEINNFYVLCYDQPWFGEGTGPDGETRNIGALNGGLYHYSLRVSESELEIDSIEPGGREIDGVEPVLIDLIVETSGGGYNGKAVCDYNIENPKITTGFTQFGSTNLNIHTQPVLQWFSGTSKISIECIDDAGNTASGESELILELDTTAPKITRAFNEGGSISVSTDENANCYYSLQNCTFPIESGEEMTIALADTHSAEWNPDNTYHIKCMDRWGNKESDCSIRVRPSEV